MRQVRNPQHHLMQCVLQTLGLTLQNPLTLAQCTAALHQFFGFFVLLVPAQHAHLLGQIIHLGTDCIALDRDLPKSGIKGNSLVDLGKELRLASASQGFSHNVNVGAQ
jgi:hypothetical protein